MRVRTIKYAMMIVGSLLIALGTNAFLIPNHVLDGGVIGIALIANYTLGLPVGFIIILCSIPMFLSAWLLNRDIFYNSLTGMLISSFIIDLLSPLQHSVPPLLEGGVLIYGAAGGALIGAGLGLMLRFETSTGGTDLLAHFISRYVPVNVGVIILCMDMVIVSGGGLLLGGATFIPSLFTIMAGGLATGICTLQRKTL